MLSDREKLLKLHGDLQKFEIPTDFNDQEIQITVNTIYEGFEIMKSWLVEQAKKKLTKESNNHEED